MITDELHCVSISIADIAGIACPLYPPKADIDFSLSHVRFVR
jgi:hypothetical protein